MDDGLTFSTGIFGRAMAILVQDRPTKVTDGCRFLVNKRRGTAGKAQVMKQAHKRPAKHRVIFHHHVKTPLHPI